MKKIYLLAIAALGVLFMGQNLAAQNQELSKKEQKELAKQQKKAQKERKKQIGHMAENISFERAAECLRNGNFVIEATQLQSRRGGITQVSSATNFISMSNGISVVQIAPSNHFAGPNGVGGITVDGKVSEIKVTENKNGSISYSYSVQGIGISATVKINLPKGSSSASATVYPNFNSNDITLTGKIVAPQNSKVFKGRAL